MNKRELNLMAMMRSLKAVFSKHAETVKSNAGLSERFDNFDNAISGILTRDNEYLTIKSGAVAAKDVAADELISVALRFMNVMFSQGRKIGDENLKAQCMIMPSDFRYFRGDVLEQACNHLLDLARIHGNDLAAYNLDVTGFESAIEKYRTQLELLRQKKAQAKASRQSLSREFKAANTIIKKDLDKLIELVKESAPDFYGEYKAARVILDLGVRHGENGKTAETLEAATPAAAPAQKLAIAA
jgi:hypothetical protein